MGTLKNRLIIFIEGYLHNMFGAYVNKYEGRSRSNRTSAITIVNVYIIKNNVYEMKAVPFIDKSAEFQTNRLMDIKYAQLLVRLVTGGQGTL